uniref:Uncharacterized protein n=1 Tax=Chromera velia CCMP2878 TaxID=1169474 RepID=A0A0G4GFJ6_9ALVE|eukprot:Cvel_21668.t1-p1 / transcript=Cvel_21668.t1 / gene=Cvel_21668 / organism=Chromera_velia_CCMP2878 / gene_product=hypothetical protein / transcript_product=hypothetical protein / location=Cvel_scaffold2052:16277-18878(-) / protein_length=386 / sequence_SO=supercontig / SO=protein_coding / is_pseudo=false
MTVPRDELIYQIDKIDKDLEDARSLHSRLLQAYDQKHKDEFRRGQSTLLGTIRKQARLSEQQYKAMKRNLELQHDLKRATETSNRYIGATALKRAQTNYWNTIAPFASNWVPPPPPILDPPRLPSPPLPSPDPYSTPSPHDRGGAHPPPPVIEGGGVLLQPHPSGARLVPVSSSPDAAGLGDVHAHPLISVPAPAQHTGDSPLGWLRKFGAGDESLMATHYVPPERSIPYLGVTTTSVGGWALTASPVNQKGDHTGQGAHSPVGHSMQQEGADPRGPMQRAAGVLHPYAGVTEDSLPVAVVSSSNVKGEGGQSQQQAGAEDAGQQNRMNRGRAGSIASSGRSVKALRDFYSKRNHSAAAAAAGGPPQALPPGGPRGGDLLATPTPP